MSFRPSKDTQRHRLSLKEKRTQKEGKDQKREGRGGREAVSSHTLEVSLDHFRESIILRPLSYDEALPRDYLSSSYPLFEQPETNSNRAKMGLHQNQTPSNVVTQTWGSKNYLFQASNISVGFGKSWDELDRHFSPLFYLNTTILIMLFPLQGLEICGEPTLT